MQGLFQAMCGVGYGLGFVLGGILYEVANKKDTPCIVYCNFPSAVFWIQSSIFIHWWFFTGPSDTMQSIGQEDK